MPGPPETTAYSLYDLEAGLLTTLAHLARLVLSLIFSIGIGLIMALLFNREDALRATIRRRQQREIGEFRPRPH